nr:MAG TPA: hypothetical protein [Caudoviricetes sp.]
MGNCTNTFMNMICSTHGKSSGNFPNSYQSYL